MTIKRSQLVFFAGLALAAALAGCNPLYEEDIKSPDDVMSIAVSRPPDKLLYRYGEAFDKTGMKVNVHFRDSEKLYEEIADTAKISISGYNPHTEGIQTITASVRGKSDTFLIALMFLPPSNSVVVGSTVTLAGVPGGPNGSWEAYVYSESVREQVHTAKGTGIDSVSFELPASFPNGSYIIAVAFRVEGKMYSKFYNLQVP